MLTDSLYAWLNYWATIKEQDSAFLDGVSMASNAADSHRVGSDSVDTQVVAYSWSALRTSVIECCDALSELVPGDRVVTQYRNGWDSLVITLALDRLHVIESPVDTRLGPAAAKRCADLVSARLSLNSDNFVVPRPSACDVMGVSTNQSRFRLETTDNANCLDQSRSLGKPRASCILWTSGTTAQPKGVVLSATGLIANAWGKLQAVPQYPSDIRLSVLPWSHAYARTCDLVTWILSGGVISAGTGWEGISQCAPRVRPTLLNAVPSLIDQILAGQSMEGAEPELFRAMGFRAMGLDRLRVLGCGGAPLSPAQFHQIQSLGIVPIQGYGLTEAGPVVCSACSGDARPGVVGRPIHDTQVKLSDQGEILCRGPGVMMEYWCDEVGTANRMTADGWLRTGDIGEIELDGALRIDGRADGVIVLKTGDKVFPESIERELSKGTRLTHVVLLSDEGDLVAIIDPSTMTTDQEIEAAFQSICKTLLRVPRTFAEMPFVVHRYERPFSVLGGELTVKGTVRRAEIIRRYKNEKRGGTRLNPTPS